MRIGPKHRSTGSAARGFTLVEMLVVIGIIVILVAMAVPAFNLIAGGRSIDGAQNTISAMLGRARAQAIGLQRKVGVVFWVDQKTKRTTMALVMHDDVNEASTAGPFIDFVSGAGYEYLPPGVGAQFTYNQSQANLDRYVKEPGLIMFDSHGVLTSTPYAISKNSALGAAMKISGGISDFPANVNFSVYSQMAIVLYDLESFNNQFDQGLTPPTNWGGFTPSDTLIGGGYPPYLPNESLEEIWLDQNSTPLLINRYNGTLVRAE